MNHIRIVRSHTSQGEKDVSTAVVERTGPQKRTCSFAIGLFNRLSHNEPKVWKRIMAQSNKFLAELNRSDASSLEEFYVNAKHLIERSPKDELSLVNVAHSLSVSLQTLDGSVDLWSKIREFIEFRSQISLPELTTLAEGVDHVKRLAFLRGEYLDMLTLVLVSKLLTPIYGELADEWRDWDKEKNYRIGLGLGRQVISPLFIDRAPQLQSMLKSYISDRTTYNLKQDPDFEKHGLMWKDSVIKTVYDTVLIRRFPTVDLAAENGDIMVYTTLAARKEIRHRIYIRKRLSE